MVAVLTSPLRPLLGGIACRLLIAGVEVILSWGVGPPPEFMMIRELESLTIEGVPSSTTVPPRTRE
ncbi:MAG TPA: hypothetical protein VK662_09160 [Acidothermaceae bacterium]|nr:hypothetical protein [Acidothermaceae bacterium]